MHLQHSNEDGVPYSRKLIVSSPLKSSLSLDLEYDLWVCLLTRHPVHFAKASIRCHFDTQGDFLEAGANFDSRLSDTGSVIIPKIMQTHIKKLILHGFDRDEP